MKLSILILIVIGCDNLYSQQVRIIDQQHSSHKKKGCSPVTIRHSVYIQGVDQILCFFQEFLKVCPLFLASTRLLLVIQKITSQ